jgi:type II secretory pathway pseudopilin PulG
MLAAVAAACSSGGPTIPTLPSTTTTAGGSTTTTEGRSTTTTEPRTTTTRSGGSTTSSSPESTSTTEAPTTTTSRASTTTTAKEATTTTTAPATVPASSSSDSSKAWLWIVAIVLLVIAAAVAIYGIVRSRSSKRKQWLASARDLAVRATTLARNLDQSAAVLAGPVGADRQVWLDASNSLAALATSASALQPDAPSVPGDPKGTNSLSAALDRLGSSLTVCRSAVGEAERTRFELYNPTTEQLDFASQSVRQACSGILGDTHALGQAVDRVDPPQGPTR